jgi:hypothetical protein
MFEIVKEAVKNFVNSVGAEVEECNEDINKGYVSKISIRGDKNYDIYLVLPHEKLSYISDFYFGDNEYDADDLSKEIANQIIGNAKSLAADRNINFEIGIPEYLGEFKNNLDFDDKMGFKFNGNKCFYILFKER